MVTREISLLSKETIDQIAAGEVVERPASVVKELVENAMDSGADAITVEIRDGGTSFIRVTDNGCGIPKEQVRLAFMRHATSKIKDASELAGVRTLGFRGEALSSISAVARVEMITKPQEQFIGCRYVLDHSQEAVLEDVGAPDGTTIMVYHLFSNMPARKKFLKSHQTEGTYVAELLERLALSHPAISFCFINNKTEKMHTSGNGNLMDAIYQIYGRDISTNLIPVSCDSELLHVEGFLGNASVARGNRSLETFFIDGRYVKTPLLSRAVEEGYHGYLMQHQYPFCVLQITTGNASVDVNVHPTKQEVRFDDEIAVSKCLTDLVYDSLHRREDIARIEVPEPVAAPETEVQSETSTTAGLSEEPGKDRNVAVPLEPFEVSRLQQIREKISEDIHKDTPYQRQYEEFYATPKKDTAPVLQEVTYEQSSFLDQEEIKNHRLIGQVFGTYWLIEYGQELYIIDQHAAHEKVLFERTMTALKEKQMTSQMISPPLIVTLTAAEQQILENYEEVFTELGFSLAPFGGNEFAITAVPGNMFSLDYRQMFMDILTSCGELSATKNYQLVLEKVASLSCKAAVKGNHNLSEPEIRALVRELLDLENPYHCPHGRPTMIAMTKTELEKKFKRIVS